MLIIPGIDLIGGRCVRLRQGNFRQPTLYGDGPVERARHFQQAGFKRLHVVDLEGARDGSLINQNSIAQICSSVDLPIQVGGGIRLADDVDRLLSTGVRWVILGTVAIEEPDRVSRWIQRFGPDHFMVSLDLRSGRLRTRGWLRESQLPLETAVRRVRAWGISRLICTDIERDGTLQSPGLATLRSLLELLDGKAELIAAGGVRSPDDLQHLAALGLSGAVVGRALYEGTHSLESFAYAG